MDVKIIPLGGCLQVFLAVFTLGVAPLAKFLNERGWPKTVDDRGLVTRGGTSIAWGEFTRVVKVLTQVTRGSSSRTTHYELFSPKGRVVVAPYRLVNGDQVWEYVWQALPDVVKYANT